MYGCATIFSGSTDEIFFTSEPSGAKVSVNGKESGKTPVTVTLKKSRGYSFTFTKDGYLPKTLDVSYHFTFGWLILDIITGVFPIIVDAITGDWHSLDESSYKAVLEPVK